MSDNTITTGCYVDGHWGQYAGARSIMVASEFGWDDSEAIDLATRHLAAMGPSDAPLLSDDEYEKLSSAVNDAEIWLNEVIAEPDHYFGWYDEEFFYQPIEQWDEIDPQ